MSFLPINVGSTQSYRAESTSDYHVTWLAFHANWHQRSLGSLSIIYTQLVIRALLTVSEVPGCQSVAFFKLQVHTQQIIIFQAPGLQEWALKDLTLLFKKAVLRVDTSIGSLMPLPFFPFHWPWMATCVQNNKLITHYSYVSPDGRTPFHIISSNVKLLSWHCVIILTNPWQ